MALPYAFVTLLTSDSYLQGALTLVAALKDLHPQPAVAPEVDFQTCCLVTPETVDVSTIKLLRKAFDVVVGVEVITSKSQRNLTLLGGYFSSSRFMRILVSVEQEPFYDAIPHTVHIERTRSRCFSRS